LTYQHEVVGDDKYVPLLDHGFVGLVDHMGSDGAIVQAARTSYGNGTKTVLEDRGLIRYLMNHEHMSPFEMCNVKLHLKIPIFVMRQLVRHRTASLNEYSGRYSVMTDEFYLPEVEHIKPQAKDNKQGRSGELVPQTAEGVRNLMTIAHESSYEVYQALLGERGENKRDVIYDPYDPEDPMFDDEFPGIARESARCVLPVSNYTELYWSQNLRNMLALIKLRLDPHAQYEIRMLAQAIYDILQPLFPAAVEAFEDYVRLSTKNSRMETDLLKTLLGAGLNAQAAWTSMLTEAGGDKAFGEKFGLSIREVRTFAEQWGFPVYAALPKG